jgi:hypothetical protein
MARQVKVTPAQRSAAQAVVSRSAKAGRFVSTSVAKIAEAKPQTTTAAGS